MLYSICQQIGKPSTGHRTEKGQFSSQFQTRAMLKIVQTTGQLHSLPMLVRLCSKSFKLHFSSAWIENFQMYKLDLEKAQEPEIKLPISVGSYVKQRKSRKGSTSVSLGASLVAQTVKRLSAMQETRVWSLGWEGPLEKEMTAHSSIVPGKSNGRRSLVGYGPWVHKESDMTERLHHHFLFHWLCLSLWLCGSQWTVENS